MRATVLGAGSWGTALASVLGGKGVPVTLWGRDAEVVQAITRDHENARYLPGIKLPAAIGATTDLARALEGAELVVLAVPSHAIRQVVIEAKRHLHAGVPIVSAAKGIEVETHMTMNEVLEDVLPVPMHPYLCFLGGPSFAKEVARNLPTAVTIAGRWERITRGVQAVFHTQTFRPYTSTDITGCEIGGCVKNVIAIAAGLSDGMGYGGNARAALITRGLTEITRLAVRKGANPLTLSGLAGMGDLVLTCSSDLSRNRRVGFGLGQGRKLEEIQRELGQVAEGVLNARSVHELALKARVDMPITQMVFRLVHESYPPQQAVTDLMMREIKSEI
ncbi:NAD(P)H-dependent glycerol-3-phosphate dehydrogenase [Anaeromyxobacter paludicola]|uniref:Glycerol-3-phosphate dehydrogenase [NAD(P)+] n=1 Tax=Anaeromyxobacter paludicola TaxID=2918171 RepID=A0ABN6NDR4_9BACT|nr:NAD(P)H-dependent glycerol-3-phosphate dehydrogenase [Anaeromyxobacter paludicola]BDG10138.1 glycerol-3-phosphate dehydrogenase [NAD(P)+] [Anaeromyxobacter paludicola]